MDAVLDVTAAQQLWGTVFLFEFSSGAKSVTDLAQVATGPIFDELRATNQLADIEVDHQLGTIVWPNGADIAPTALLVESIASSVRKDPVERSISAAKGRFVKVGYSHGHQHRLPNTWAREVVRHVSFAPYVHFNVRLNPIDVSPGSVAISFVNVPTPIDLDSELAEFQREIEARAQRGALT